MEKSEQVRIGYTMAAKKLTDDVQVGDWLVVQREKHLGWDKVERVTPKLIYMRGNVRYRREDGTPLSGYGGFGRLRCPTPKELEERAMELVRQHKMLQDRDAFTARAEVKMAEAILSQDVNTLLQRVPLDLLAQVYRAVKG